MKIEYVRDEPTLDGCEGLLAILLYSRGAPLVRESSFLTGQQEPLQVGQLYFPKGHIVPAHVHNSVSRNTTRTQEALVVLSGCVILTIFTSAGRRVGGYLLAEKDIAILLSGGHSLEALEETFVVEVKTGPYQGRELDKRPL